MSSTALAFALAATTLLTPVAAPAPIEGYVESGADSAAVVVGSAGQVATIGYDGVQLRPGGGGLTPLPVDAAASVAEAHRAGRPIELLVSNYSSRQGDFSPRIATRMLRSSAKRERVADALAADVASVGFDGVQLDLESLRPRDRAGLVAFAAAVKQRLGEHQLSLAAMASRSERQFRAHGYDLPALAGTVDRLVLMTYDRHGPWSGPGPIGPLPWARGVVAAALGAGWSRDHVDLGVAGYGYAWDPRRTRMVTAARAASRAGARAVWSERTGEWSARLPGGTRLYWSDARSLEVRRDLATELGLHGVALWSLNLSPVLAP